MRIQPLLSLGFIALFTGTAAAAGDALPARADRAAGFAADHYAGAQVDLLADLVRFRTVHQEDVANVDNPEFRKFKQYLETRAKAFGFDVTDYGAVLVIGYGDAKSRLGVVTHGDVQPADASKWNKSPFELDTASEPGRLIARGSEDDKAAIATALYAMKSLKDLGLPVTRRIELIVALTEESDWAPFQEVLTRYTPPGVNIGIDSDYPVVVAEKGWGGVQLVFKDTVKACKGVTVERFEGGAFMSQVPEDATLAIDGGDSRLLAQMRDRAAEQAGMQFTFEQSDNGIVVHGKGKAAHSSTPENGVNALAHAAALLEGETLCPSPAAAAVDFVNALIRTDIYGEHFGNIAWRHDFMGPLTVNLSTATMQDGATQIGINLRAPAGKSTQQLETELREAIAGWSQSSKFDAPDTQIFLSDAYLPEQPPQVEPLLAVYRHFTGDKDAKPISIGGGTNARLLPGGINFGPSMPGVAYSGHSEHEFITRKQMELNLRMYAAMLAWLGAGEAE